METPQHSPKHARFSGSFDAASNRYVVRLAAGFAIDDWPGIEKLSREQLAEGRIHWTIDMTEIKDLSSRLMGQCIGLNAVLGIRGGGLELRVKHDSPVALELNKAKLSRIMSIVET